MLQPKDSKEDTLREGPVGRGHRCKRPQYVQNGVALSVSQGSPSWWHSSHTHSPSLYHLPSVPGSCDARQGPLTVCRLASPTSRPFPCPLSLPHQPPLCSTKQLLADIMQFHPGDSFKEILSLPASSPQVLSHSSLLHPTSTTDSFPWTPPIVCHKQIPLTSNESSRGLSLCP